ncbi:TPA: YolD-like family protein [Bacillus thuringiensis]|nr:YolD-like family protein [Bacillus cereus]HDR4796347.1 YolD-like family protein [Bacillus cereus]HDR4802295.1 YolD-like family protein [Bacillus cereus]HDR4808200.1 YolD-like family protein [Bacillus cereus]HDR4831065.1 YolD-like family protein [Bacillus cereus]
MKNLNKVPKPIITEDTKIQIKCALTKAMHQNKEILISYYRDGTVNDMYINLIHIDSRTKIVYCTDTFGLLTKFKIDEFVRIAH